jgi:hypothetical protein
VWLQRWFVREVSDCPKGKVGWDFVVLEKETAWWFCIRKDEKSPKNTGNSVISYVFLNFEIRCFSGECLVGALVFANVALRLSRAKLMDEWMNG